MGNVPLRAGERDVEELFNKFGRIKFVSLKKSFGFVEFDDDRDADDAVRDMDGCSLLGQRFL